MPELPEIETTKRGISPLLINQDIINVTVRHTRLRLPVTPELHHLCANKRVLNITRRAKYLLLQLSEGYIVIHLGMSGHLRIVNAQTSIRKHDHIDLGLSNGTILRYNDPRRFGLWLYIPDAPLEHPLFKHLGPEPLTDEFSADYLSKRACYKKQCIKSFIMDNRVVVGVGNIYAAESLFLAKIHPQTAAGQVPEDKMRHLTGHIKKVLQNAIQAGGTTLRDFYAADGKPGYFSQALNVYGRQYKPCHVCETIIEALNIAGRNSAFCPKCQPENT